MWTSAPYYSSSCSPSEFKLPPHTRCKSWSVAAAGTTSNRMSLFSWGPANAVSVSCEHLPLSAYGCIPLYHPGLLCIILHPSVSPCISGKVSGWWAGFHSACSSPWEAVKSEGARLAGGCVHSVCSDAIHTMCVKKTSPYVFFNYVAPGSGAIYWEEAGFPPVQQCIYSSASAGTERMHLGTHPGGLTVHQSLIFICFLIVHSISYNIIYFKRYLYILYYSQPFSSLAGSNPPAQDGALATGMWDRVLLSRDHSAHWGALWLISSYLLSQSWQKQA